MLEMIYKAEISPITGAIIAFVAGLLFLGAIGWFFINIGDRVQLISSKTSTLIKIGSYLPSLLTYILLFAFNVSDFVTSFPQNLLITSILLILVSVILKFVGYRTIEYESIRGISVLETGKTVISAKNIKIHYPIYGGLFKKQINSVKAVDGISFQIKTGETLGLVGESGCGKSTVAQGLLGFVDLVDGEIFFNEKPIPKPFPNELRKRIQIVFQDPNASLDPRKKIVALIGEPLRNLLGMSDSRKIRLRVLELLEMVSMKKEHLDRFPHEFSGGQKQRIIIARALACNPELIILDEPTSALDVSVQAQILNLLKSLQKKYGFAYLFITHDLSVVNHIADNIAVMYLGKLVEIGPVDKIFTNPSHPYTKALLSARSEIDPDHKITRIKLEGEVPSPINPPTGCSFHPRCQATFKGELCSQELPHKVEIEPSHTIWCCRDCSELNRN